MQVRMHSRHLYFDKNWLNKVAEEKNRAEFAF